MPWKFQSWERRITFENNSGIFQTLFKKWVVKPARSMFCAFANFTASGPYFVVVNATGRGSEIWASLQMYDRKTSIK